MKHNDNLHEKLSAYLDGALDAQSRAEIEEILSTSEDARAELEALRRVHSSLLGAPVADPGDAYWSQFSKRVESRLAARVETTSFYERLTAWFFPKGQASWWRAATAVATVSVLAYVGVRGFRDVEGRFVAPTPSLQEAPGEVPSSALEKRGKLEKSEVQPEQQAVERPRALGSADGVRSKSRSGSAEGAKVRVLPETPLLADPEPVALKERPTESARPQQRADDVSPTAGAMSKSKEDVALQEEKATVTEWRSETDKLEAQSFEIRNQVQVRPVPPPAALSQESTHLKMLQASPPAAGEVSLDEVSDAAEIRGMPDQPLRVTALQTRPSEQIVLSFVAAAIAEDTSRARERFAEFLVLESEVSRPEEKSMRAWLQSKSVITETGSGSSLHARRQAAQFSSRADSPLHPMKQALIALDGLLWPRRERPESRQLVEQLALRYEDFAQSGGEVRGEARRYLFWLAENASDPAARPIWRQRAESIPE